MKDSNANYEALMRSFLELTELKHILRKTQTFFEEVSCLFLMFCSIFCSFLKQGIMLTGYITLHNAFPICMAGFVTTATAEPFQYGPRGLQHNTRVPCA